MESRNFLLPTACCFLTTAVGSFPHLSELPEPASWHPSEATAPAGQSSSKPGSSRPFPGAPEKPAAPGNTLSAENQGVVLQIPSDFYALIIPTVPPFVSVLDEVAV